MTGWAIICLSNYRKYLESCYVEFHFLSCASSYGLCLMLSCGTFCFVLEQNHIFFHESRLVLPRTFECTVGVPVISLCDIREGRVI
jgi:hypothetical protein